MNTQRIGGCFGAIAVALVLAGCTGALAGGTISGNPDPVVREVVLTDAERAQGCRYMGWDWHGQPRAEGPLERWEYIDVNGSSRNAGGLIEMRCPYPNVNHPSDPIVVTRRFCVPARVSTEPERDKPVRGGVYDHGVLVGCKR